MKLIAHETVASLNKYMWVFMLGAAFILIYWLALTPVYFESDFTFAITYHLLGGDSTLQAPYTARQGMMDLVLSLLPEKEGWLRIGAVAITSIAMTMMMLLMLGLVFEWIGGLSSAQRLLVTIVVLLASPEFFYLGLVFVPAAIAMCCLLAAHLLLRRIPWANAPMPLVSHHAVGLFFAGVLLFGLGVSFRWSAGAYASVIMVDLLALSLSGRSPKKGGVLTKLALVAGWIVLAVVASLMAIRISGYSLTDILDNLRTAEFVMLQNQIGDESGAGPAINVRTLMTALALLTPVALGLAVLGVLKMVLERREMLWVVVASALAVLPWIPSGNPKFMIIAWPAFLLAVALGLLWLWDGISHRLWQWLARFGLIGSLLVTWLVGVQIVQPGSAWGPGFELRAYDRVEPADRQLRLVMDSGAAFPTPEGNRPVFGHAYVLFGGLWRSLVTSVWEEFRGAVEDAQNLNVPILITQFSASYATNELIRQGYRTTDRYDRLYPANPYFAERRFFAEGLPDMTVFYREIDGPGDSDDLHQIASLSQRFRTIIVTGYPKLMRQLFETAPTALWKLGPTSARLNPAILANALHEASNGNEAVAVHRAASIR